MHSPVVVSALVLVIITIFVWSHKVVISEVLVSGSVLLRRGREKAQEKRNFISRDLNTVTGSLLRTAFSNEYQAAVYHCVCLLRVGRSWYKDLTVSVLELSVIVLIAVIIVIHCPTGPTAWNSVQYVVRYVLC